jgi:hypothetical protein
MFTIRNLGGVALFLFGTTFLWLTPMFASKNVLTTGVAWSITQVMSLLTIAGFSLATWGVFARAEWWEPVAVAFAVFGLLALVPYLVAARAAGEAPAVFNAFVHVVGSVGVLVLLLVPSLERWVNGHVMSGR